VESKKTYEAAFLELRGHLEEGFQREEALGLVDLYGKWVSLLPRKVRL
jgi:hypothetical protein